MLHGCLPEQLLDQAGSSLGVCESDRLHPWHTNGRKGGRSVGTWLLTHYGESHGRSSGRRSHLLLLLTTSLWNKIHHKLGGSRKSICCWLGASPIKKHSFAILVAAWNAHSGFAHKLFLISCRWLWWLFSGSLFAYLAIFARSKEYWTTNEDISLLLSSISDFLSSKHRSKSSMSGLKINCLSGSWSKQIMEILLALSLEKWLWTTSSFQARGLVFNWLVIRHGKIHQQIAWISVLEN